MTKMWDFFDISAPCQKKYAVYVSLSRISLDRMRIHVLLTFGVTICDTSTHLSLGKRLYPGSQAPLDLTLQKPYLGGKACENLKR